VGPREFYETIDSTQDRAIELARSGAPEGTLVVARTQRLGRGRLDHRWWSPAGDGVYLSIVLRAPPAPRTLLALAVGAELRTTLRTRAGLTPVLKWPNDLLMPDGPFPPRKISGILIDEVESPSLGMAEVVGVGMNVRTSSGTAPRARKSRVAALEDWVRPPPTLEAVEEWIVHAALRAGERLRSPSEARTILDECRAALYGVGHSVRVDGVPAGVLDTLGEEGELWLVRGRERVAIRTGDVEVE
jgi:biotin-(acetyl-CoA carboxylase) ligase